MRSFYCGLILLLGLAGCSTPAPTRSAIELPPMPSEAPRPLRSTVTRREPIIMSAAAPSNFAPSTPSAPKFTELQDLVITNQSTVILKLSMGVMGFGIAYSEDLVQWTYIGEAHWTNATPINPFIGPGLTEHRVWIGENQWSSVHTPGASTQWKLTIVDQLHPKRFFRVYPLEAVTGLP